MPIPPPPLAWFYKPEKWSFKDYLLIALVIGLTLGFCVAFYFVFTLRLLG